MVLILTISKAAVVYQQPGLWNIVMHLTAVDTGTTVIDKDYSVEFRPADSITDKAPELIEMMQIDIDEYKGEQLISKNVELAKLATTVKAALNVEAALEA